MPKIAAYRSLFSALVGACMISLITHRTQALAGQGPGVFGITVIEKDSSWPVSMVELRTVHQVRFISDNAGRIAFDLPELMGQETWFDVTSDGYEVPANGHGMRGVRLTPKLGEAVTIKVDRTSIAKRLGRLTGA